MEVLAQVVQTGRVCLCGVVAAGTLFGNVVAANPAEVGAWGASIAWPFVPVSALQQADGTVTTWASNEVDAFPTADQFTYAASFDPTSERIVNLPNRRHDMFCAGSSILADGTVLVAGGNPALRLTSRLDGDTWLAEDNMDHARWYGTVVTLAEGDAFATFAKRAGSNSELWQPGVGWSGLPRASMATLEREQNIMNSAGGTGTSGQWFAFMHLAPNGRVFHAGPTPTMHWFDTGGLGGVSAAGTRLGENRVRQFGSSVMYDEGKLLLTGGGDQRFSPSSTASALTIDINGAAPVVRSVANMVRPRTYHNSVVMPNGEVFVVGGNQTGIQFSDGQSVMTPEIWNPDSRQWRAMANHRVPRNYHSIAVLLQDGRILTGGGGLCGPRCGVNHPNVEIFSPPYLFGSDGTPASRPTIEFAGDQARSGGNLFVKTASPVNGFSMVRLGSTTHSNNSDQRFLRVSATPHTDTVYELAVHANPNVIVPGPWWLFALDADGVPSTGHVVNVAVGRADAVAPALPTYADRADAVGTPVSIDLLDGVGGVVSVDVVGLPTGLQATGGRVEGNLQREGQFPVSVFVESAGRTTHARFLWQVSRDGVVTAAGDTAGGSGGGGALWLLALVLIPVSARRRRRRVS